MSSVSGALPFPFSLIWFLGLTAARTLYRYLEGLQWSIEALFQVPSVEEWVNSSNTLAISSGCLLVVIRRCRSHPLQACFHCRINPWASLYSCRPDVSSDFSAAFLSSLPCPSWPSSSPPFQGLSIFFPSRFSLSFNLVQFIPLLRLFFFFCSCPVFYAVFILLCYFFWIPGSPLRFLSLSGGNPWEGILPIFNQQPQFLSIFAWKITWVPYLGGCSHLPPSPRLYACAVKWAKSSPQDWLFLDRSELLKLRLI